MHLFISFVLILGFCLLLVFGLLSVLQDMMARDFLAVPAMSERDSPGDYRYRSANSPCVAGPTDLDAAENMSGARRS
jgi:hypothetical protein